MTLVVAKRSARSVKIKTLNQIRHLSYTAPDQLRARLKDVSRQQLAAQAAALRPGQREGADPVLVATKTAGLPRPRPAARPAQTPGARHASPGTGHSAAAARRSSGSGPSHGHDASNQTRTPAALHTTGRPDEGTPPHGQLPHRHRPAAGTAIRWPWATHRLGSLPAAGSKTKARRDPSRSAQTARSCPAQGKPGRWHRQRAQPDARHGCSGNKAVNTCRACSLPAPRTRRDQRLDRAPSLPVVPAVSLASPAIRCDSGAPPGRRVPWS